MLPLQFRTLKRSISVLSNREFLFFFLVDIFLGISLPFAIWAITSRKSDDLIFALLSSIIILIVILNLQLIGTKQEIEKRLKSKIEALECQALESISQNLIDIPRFEDISSLISFYKEILDTKEPFFIEVAENVIRESKKDLGELKEGYLKGRQRRSPETHQPHPAESLFVVFWASDYESRNQDEKLRYKRWVETTYGYVAEGVEVQRVCLLESENDEASSELIEFLKEQFNHGIKLYVSYKKSLSPSILEKLSGFGLVDDKYATWIENKQYCLDHKSETLEDFKRTRNSLLSNVHTQEVKSIDQIDESLIKLGSLANFLHSLNLI